MLYLGSRFISDRNIKKNLTKISLLIFQKTIKLNKNVCCDAAGGIHSNIDHYMVLHHEHVM